MQFIAVRQRTAETGAAIVMMDPVGVSVTR
jgi:hypothetical protein